MYYKAFSIIPMLFSYDCLQVFQCMVEFISDASLIRRLLNRQKNFAGLTATEYAAKYGSPAMLTEMLNYPNLIKHTAFAVSKNHLSFGEPDMGSVHKPEKSSEPVTTLEYVNVSIYEAGSFRKLSALLNMLSCRPVSGMSRADLELFHKLAFMGKYV